MSKTTMELCSKETNVAVAFVQVCRTASFFYPSRLLRTIALKRRESRSRLANCRVLVVSRSSGRKANQFFVS